MIIGITGRAGSGKSTVAGILVRDHGFVAVSLADGIKRICRDVFHFTDAQLWGPSSERDKPDMRYLSGGVVLTPRRALQTLGTEWGRALYENVWIDHALRAADILLSSEGGYEYRPEEGLTKRHAIVSGVKGIIIPDVRFPNEVDAIRAQGGVIWKTTHGHGLVGVAGTHESEQHIDRIIADATFGPNNTLDELPGVVAKFLQWYQERTSK